MNGLPYYKRYPRDFIEGTIGMPFELKATYSIILDLIYMQGGKLPDDARYISGLLGVSIRKWKTLRNGLLESGKITHENGVLTNYRAVSELETLTKLQDKQRENASGPRKNKGLEKPQPSHTEPEPEPEREEPNGSLSFADEISSAVSAYNAAASESGWPVVRVLGRARQSALSARLRECGGLDGWLAALAKAQASNHCCGQNDRGWVANFDFLARQSSFVKLIEGNYDNRRAKNSRTGDGDAADIARRAADRYAERQRSRGVDRGPGTGSSQPLLSAGRSR